MQQVLVAMACSLIAVTAYGAPPWVQACEARARVEAGNPRGFKLVEPGAVERGEGRYMVAGKGVWRDKVGPKKMGVYCPDGLCACHAGVGGNNHQDGGSGPGLSESIGSPRFDQGKRPRRGASYFTSRNA